jgi:uncharacterized protein (DUF2249 family)
MADLTDPVHVIDVRTIAPAQRHSQIFATFDALPAGGTLELVNDHDPVPLYFQFEKMRPGQFRWDYLQSGPALWQVRIRRVALGEAGAVTSECCGSCSCR